MIIVGAKPNSVVTSYGWCVVPGDKKSTIFGSGKKIYVICYGTAVTTCMFEVSGTSLNSKTLINKSTSTVDLVIYGVTF